MVAQMKPKDDDVDAGLEGLASWFHQDWKLIYPDIPTAARDYLQGRSATERESLRRELKMFLEAKTGRSSEQIRSAWIALGAQSWPRGEDASAALVLLLAEI